MSIGFSGLNLWLLTLSLTCQAIAGEISGDNREIHPKKDIHLLDSSDSNKVGQGQCGMNNYPLALVPYEEAAILPFNKLQRQFIFEDITVKIKQDWKSTGVAGVVWDSAVSLGHYLVKNRHLVENKKIIELGAGTGLTGIVAVNLGAQVTVTDRKSSLHSLEENIIRNKLTDADINVKALDWSQEITADIGLPFDIVLGADIIYIEESFPHLLRTLEDISSCNTQILLAQKIRYERDTRFISLLREKFSVEELEYQKEADIYIYDVRKKC